MKEIGINTSWIEQWPSLVSTIGWENALTHPKVPNPAKYFMSQTKKFVDSDKPWIICSALALGREELLPEQFQSVLEQLEAAQIPSEYFKWYLARHVTVDSNDHGPAARRLLEELCGDDESKHQEATDAALQAIKAREKFWDLIIQENYIV
jgi:hypothetical protein